MSNIVKNKKKYLISIACILFATIAGVVTFFIFPKTMTLKNETIKIEGLYLKNYSSKNFIKTSLRNIDFYNKKNLIKYISNNFESFLKSNTELSGFIYDYALLYRDSFEILRELKKDGTIISKDYREINKMLSGFEFNEILGKLTYLTLKYNSNDSIAKKKYFEGIVAELALNYEAAKNFYQEAINLNSHDVDYYSNLGNVYYKLYDFNGAIEIFENGLNVPNLENRKYKSNKMELLYNLSKTYNTIRDTNKASVTYTNLLIESLETNNNNYKWIALYNLAFIEANHGNYNVSLDYLKYALNIATKNKNKLQIANSLNALSKIQYRYGDYSRGIKNSLKAIKISKQISAMSLLADSSLTSCLNYEYLNKNELANVYCSRAIKINDTMANEIGRPEYYIQNGYIYSFVGSVRDYNRALEYYTTAYNISHKLNLFMLESSSLAGISECKNILGDRESAIQDLIDSNNIEEKLGIKSKPCYLCQLGFLYWNNKEYNRAIDTYKNAILYGVLINNNLVISSASSHLASIYYTLDNYKDALKYSDLSIDMNRKIYRFDHHYIKYEQTQRQNIIDKLEKSGKNNSTSHRRSRKQPNKQSK